MLVIAHRGVHAAAPENTLDAFAAALDAGADGVETDVRLSRDGHAVLVHDRVLPGGVPVEALDWRAIERAAGHAVPRLADALDAFPTLFWNVEIKSADALAESVRVLRPHLGRVRLLVSSFRHDVIARVAELLPVACGLLCAHRPRDVAAVTRDFAGCTGVRALIWSYDVLDDNAVWEAAAEGWESHVYGPQTPEEHVRCARLELAGTITDHTALARAALRA